MAYSEKTKNETKNETKANRPIDEVRFGSCKVVVWKNDVKNGGTMLNFTIARLYKEKESDEWKETQSLGVHDLLALAELEQKLEEARITRFATVSYPVGGRADGQTVLMLLDGGRDEDVRALCSKVLRARKS